MAAVSMGQFGVYVEAIQSEWATGFSQFLDTLKDTTLSTDCVGLPNEGGL